MTNSVHIKVLEQGVEAWNRWREENPLGTPDLRDAYLSNRNLQGINLSRGEWRANLIGANLSYADLTGANLREASLNLAELTGIKLNQADLRGAELLDSTLHFADLSGADCRDANFCGLMLVNTIFPCSSKHMNLRLPIWTRHI
jgi:Uncharacterized low-complexity proteins